MDKIEAAVLASTQQSDDLHVLCPGALREKDASLGDWRRRHKDKL